MLRLPALVLGVVVCLCQPASAAAHIGVVDLPQRPTDQGQHTIILEAPDDAWGIRAAARSFSRRVDGLVIRSNRGATCDQTVSCIRVFVGRFDHDCGDLGRRWYACSSIGTDPGVIWLDTRTSTLTRRNKACHELGHALGLRHHEHRGCLGAGFLVRPSGHEVRALDAVF